MDAREPDLTDALLINKWKIRSQVRRGVRRLCCLAPRVIIDTEQPVRFRLPRDLVGTADVALVPNHRTERVAFVFQRERMASLVNFHAHKTIRHRQWPDPVIDRTRHFLDRTAIGIHGVPNPHKVNALDLGRFGGRAYQLAQNPALKLDRGIAYIAQKGKKFEDASGKTPPIETVSIGGEAREIGFIVIVPDQPLSCDHPGHNADRERATAEAETVNVIPRLIISAAETVDVDHIALQAEPEDATQNGKCLERRRAYTVVVVSDLAGGIAQVEYLKEPPDISLENLCRAVAGPVRQQDDVFRHGCPRSRMPLNIFRSEIAGNANCNQSGSSANCCKAKWRRRS